MNKIVALSVAVLLSFSVLTGCAGTNDEDVVPEQTSTAMTEAPTTTTTTTTITTTTTTTSQPSSKKLDGYKNEYYKDAFFEVPESWLRFDIESGAFFYGKLFGSAPFIMLNHSSLDVDVELDPALAKIFWTPFVTAAGAEDFEIVSTPNHDFARYEFVQTIEDKKYIANCASTYSKKDVYTIAMLCDENEPDKNHYDSILDNVVESFLIKGSATSTTPTTAAKVGDNTIVIGKPIHFDDFNIVITELKVVKTWDKKDALRITYDWTNTSDVDQSPFISFKIKGFQNGVETDGLTISDHIDLGSSQKTIKPGAKIKGAHDAVFIENMNAPLLLELSELFSWDGEVYSMEIEDLKKYK